MSKLNAQNQGITAATLRAVSAHPQEKPVRGHTIHGEVIRLIGDNKVPANSVRTALARLLQRGQVGAIEGPNREYLYYGIPAPVITTRAATPHMSRTEVPRPSGMMVPAAPERPRMAENWPSVAAALASLPTPAPVVEAPAPDPVANASAALVDAADRLQVDGTRSAVVAALVAAGWKTTDIRDALKGTAAEIGAEVKAARAALFAQAAGDATEIAGRVTSVASIPVEATLPAPAVVPLLLPAGGYDFPLAAIDLIDRSRPGHVEIVIQSGNVFSFDGPDALAVLAVLATLRGTAAPEVEALRARVADLEGQIMAERGEWMRDAERERAALTAERDAALELAQQLEDKIKAFRSALG